jgi:hypothetical protein
VLEPPGLSHSFFARDGVMTRRFVVRHNRDQDGTLSAMPTYWAMKAFQSVIVEGGGMGEVVVPLLVTAGFGVAFTVTAAARFRLDDAKAHYG